MSFRSSIRGHFRLGFAISALAAIIFSAFFAASAGASGEPATVTFRKVFKQSFPEFVEIKVTDLGSATYDIRQLDEQPSPQPFEITRALVDKVFQLTAKLHDFDSLNLDVHRRIADLGQKTFRYEKGNEVHEVVFNYTLDATANQLLDIFEGLGRMQVDLENLQRSMKYDRLGVNDALVRVESDYNNKLFPEPERLLPTLDQLSADEKYLDIARQRARSLASRIRSSHT